MSNYLGRIAIVGNHFHVHALHQQQRVIVFILGLVDFLHRRQARLGAVDLFRRRPTGPHRQ